MSITFFAKHAICVNMGQQASDVTARHLCTLCHAIPMLPDPSYLLDILRISPSIASSNCCAKFWMIRTLKSSVCIIERSIGINEQQVCLQSLLLMVGLHACLCPNEVPAGPQLAASTGVTGLPWPILPGSLLEQVPVGAVLPSSSPHQTYIACAWLQTGEPYLKTITRKDC